MLKDKERKNETAVAFGTVKLDFTHTINDQCVMCVCSPGPVTMCSVLSWSWEITLNLTSQLSCRTRSSRKGDSHLGYS